MLLYEKLSIPRGVTAVIGSGGKTTPLRTLARELPGTVLLATTTHILPFEGVPLVTDGGEAAVRRALAESRVVCVGTPFSVLTRLADYVLVEADGSRRLPLKAHAPHEPVIPPEAKRVLCVVGARGFGRPIREAVHRPEVFCTLTGSKPGNTASPENVMQALAAEGLSRTFLLTGATDAQFAAFSLAAAAHGLTAIALPPQNSI